MVYCIPLKLWWKSNWTEAPVAPFRNGRKASGGQIQLVCFAAKWGTMNQLKNICYRGGIACFDIPASWKEEYEPSGGATFYEDNPDSGTLRLSVLGFSSNGNETGEQMVANLIAKKGYNALRDGLAIKQYFKSVEEDGEALHIYHWDIAVPVQGNNARLAIFSYTILASQATDKQVQQEIELLGTCIQNGEYSRDDVVGGDY